MTDSHDIHRRAPRRLLALGATLLVLAIIAKGGAAALARIVGAPAEDWAGGLVASFGPVAVVVLLALAVVASPIPSGPVAMAAGAIYGPWVGGGLTAAGALLGAMIAFGLSRRFGRGPLSRSSRPLAVWMTRPRSQPTLMGVVLLSRLVPFISFDAVSYLAGLTRLETWRFAVATLVGAAPVCFAFAAMGAGVANGGSWPFAALACGVTLLLPALAFAGGRIPVARRRRGSRLQDSGGSPMLAWMRSRVASVRPSACDSPLR